MNEVDEMLDEDLRIQELDRQLRIMRALKKARDMPRKAWKLGYSSINGDECFEVYSSGFPKADTGPYYVRLHEDSSMGGHVYARSANEPHVWLRCSCTAYVEFNNPCWHSAKVQLRLNREAKRHVAKATPER